VKLEPLRVVPRSEDADGVGGDGSGRRDGGQEPAVRSPEAQLSVGLSTHLVALLVNGAVVAATEQCEIRQGGRASVRPVAEVMPLAERQPASWETAASVAVVERSP
jgi:hypothetical protein